MINFARLFNGFRQNLDNVLDEAHMHADLYWFFSVTTDVDGEVTFEGVANTYNELVDLLRIQVDEDLISDIITKLYDEGVEVAAKYEPTILIDYSETENSLEVEYCVLINIVEV